MTYPYRPHLNYKLLSDFYCIMLPDIALVLFQEIYVIPTELTNNLVKNGSIKK